MIIGRSVSFSRHFRGVSRAIGSHHKRESFQRGKLTTLPPSGIFSAGRSVLSIRADVFCGDYQVLTAKKQEPGDGASNNSNDKQKVSSSAPALPLRQIPRRIIVKRGNPAAKESVESSINKERSTGKIGQMTRQVRRKKVSTRKVPLEVRDTQGQPILTVPRQQSTGNEKSKEKLQSLTGKLPILNASALLHTRDYCVRSAQANKSKSGTAAARRLLRGQNDLLQVLRKLVHPDENNTNGSNHSGATKERLVNTQFLLQGHGVPMQLLQEHINLADAILTHYNDAAACSFHQHSTTKVDVEWLRIRDRDGSNRIVPWPPTVNRTPYSWQDSMQLYVQVMHRMFKRLGDVLLPPTDHEVKDSMSASSSDDSQRLVDDYHNEFQSASMSEATPHHWNAEFVRIEEGYEQRDYNDDSNVPQLIVEWTPIRQGNFAPGHVRLQLQGVPQLLKEDKFGAVRLSLDAAFRWKS